MAYYQHYSFDLWLTLIKSNPEFKAARTRLFHRDYNSGGKSLDEVAQVFRTVDLCCNAVNERTGKNIDADEMYLMVISLINDNKVNLHDIDTDQLYAEMEALLFANLPVLYEPATAEVLGHLKAQHDVTCSILSNTGFIKGATLRKVLFHMDIAQYFSFQLYSDELSMSKPNPLLFRKLLEHIRHTKQGRDIGVENIVHVGDNHKADICGANTAGIKSMLINSNNVPISNLIS